MLVTCLVAHPQILMNIVMRENCLFEWVNVVSPYFHTAGAQAIKNERE
jgi:hypothetical protein